MLVSNFLVDCVTAIGLGGIYFTYSFASTLIELFQKQVYNDDEIITFFVNHLKKLPNAEEVKEIVKIYRS